MIPRPKPTDSMADVLKMQEDYLKSKKEGESKPAAQAINRNADGPKQSSFAKKRNHKPSDDSDKKLKTTEVIGDVIERRYDGTMVVDAESLEETNDELGFPKPETVDMGLISEKKGQSIFSQLIARNHPEKDGESSKENYQQENNLPTLDGMSEEEILEEQAKLIKSMDPKLLEFVRSRKKSDGSKSESSPKPKSDAVKFSNTGDLPALDLLKDDRGKDWVHFDILEPEKLEWTRNVETTFRSLKPGESFEARFDWNGFLLPYIDTEEKDKDNRELFLHGEDPDRPGYTLQEFFRLARATVLQQRVAAINAIAGIINIYNQGFYDSILELPISKMFFFLRFAMDENVPIIVEVSSRALSYLFYNDSDETLLDVAYETKYGFVQPLLNNKRSAISGLGQDEAAENDLETSLKNLSLEGGSRKLFESKVEDFVDDLEDRESVDDYHMAEVNLVECLVRTNIIERISYILTLPEPNDVTIQACVKILIRLARSSYDLALKILNKTNLMEKMIKDFLPSLEGTREPYFIVIKLFRVISSYDRSFCLKLMNMGVLEIVKNYVCSATEGKIRTMKVQIESFRLLRLYFHLTMDESTFKELIVPIRYLLEWHFQHLDFHLDKHFVVRQHASALLNLLSCGNIVVTFPIFSEPLKMCFSKWFTMATRGGQKDFSQKLLLSTSLSVASPFVQFSAEFFYNFIDDYLLKYLQSNHYKQLARNLCDTTPLLKTTQDRCSIHRPLINLGSVVRTHNKSPPTLIFREDYSIFLMESLMTFTAALDNMHNVKNHDYHHKLCSAFYTESIEKYFETFSVSFNRNVSTNWFLKTEINFIYNLMNSRCMQFNSCLLKVAFNLLNCLTQENLHKIFEIFKTYIFKETFYFGIQVSFEELERWKIIYNGVVMSKIEDGGERQKYIAVAEHWNQLMLSDSWPYSPLLILLYKVEIDGKQKRLIDTKLSEREIIMTTLKFTRLLEKNKINLITTNQQLMYLMLVYFDENLSFLEDPIKRLIFEKLQMMRNFTFPPKFNLKLNKEKSFEDLYTMFLDTFQSHSYGDEFFSVLVMIPLAMKYDVKWRNKVWSEYVMTMKFIKCKEKDLFGDLNDYLFPIETDVTLLKSYAMAIKSGVLTQGSIPWRIADHHVKNSKQI